MNIWINILISVFASIMIADVLPFVKEIKYRLKRQKLKPFDCNFCLSGWISLTLSIIWYESIAMLLISIFVTPFITAFTYYIWTKIKP
jgi:hypothetical protein